MKIVYTYIQLTYSFDKSMGYLTIVDSTEVLR